MNQMYNNSKTILIVAFAIFVFAAGASAQMGRGYDSQGRMHHGPGRHHGGYGGPGCGAFSNLSEEENKKLEEERTAFFEATQDLRRQIYQKRLELASEMAKKDPDAAIAAAVQKEISEVKAQMAQKRLDHIFRIRKINPDLGMGSWGGGPMRHGMMRLGGHGNWGSPDCPYMGRGGGYGMGVGMMGHSGGCDMMGPGRWRRDDSRQYHKGQGSETE